jgi:glycogen(starch) synthase
MTADTAGGVWTYACELGAALEPYGIEVLLASMGGQASRNQRAQLRHARNVLLLESEFKLEWMDDPWSDVCRAGDWLRNIEERYRPDIIHLNNFAHGDLDWNAPVLMVGHSCVLSWWEAVHKCPAPDIWELYAERVRCGLQSADVVIAPSHAMAASLDRHYGPLREMEVIPNGRLADQFQAAEKERFVFAAGRIWDEAKNISALARVADQIAWEVRLAGDLGNALRVPDATYLGLLSETGMSWQLSHAPIYALPARYEPFGLSVLEAALCECALVLGSIDSLHENWEGAALFVDPDDTDELASVLNLLIRDDCYRTQLGQAARAMAESFTPSRMAERYVRRYQALLSKKHVSTCA